MPNSTRQPAVTAGAPVAASSAATATGPAVRAPGDATDPRWWVAPLAATVVAPLLSFLVAVWADLFTALPVLLIGGFALPLALVVPGWCLARTRRRRQARINLAALACLLAVAYPALIGGIGVIFFVVMLLTGNIHS
ncbi:hypothetical protein ACFV14_17800 [Streptomyces zaomyceticus]|uniref:hypothetical protein n=1 Tax=Streptomyces zaomyceticus TaxID=68286 RepID=UPI0036A68502